MTAPDPLTGCECSAGQPLLRKRGRPRIKEVVLGAKRPAGRPRGSGSLKKLRGKEDADAPSAKKRVGRRPKVKDSGGVVINFGRFVSERLLSLIIYFTDNPELSLCLKSKPVMSATDDSDAHSAESAPFSYSNFYPTHSSEQQLFKFASNILPQHPTIHINKQTSNTTR
jgi:hypothetical protein